MIAMRQSNYPSPTALDGARTGGINSEPSPTARKCQQATKFLELASNEDITKVAIPVPLSKGTEKISEVGNWRRTRSLASAFQRSCADPRANARRLRDIPDDESAGNRKIGSKEATPRVPQYAFTTRPMPWWRVLHVSPLHRSAPGRDLSYIHHISYAFL